MHALLMRTAGAVWLAHDDGIAANKKSRWSGRTPMVYSGWVRTGAVAI